MPEHSVTQYFAQEAGSLLQENRRLKAQRDGLAALLELAADALSPEPRHDNLAREIKSALEEVR